MWWWWTRRSRRAHFTFYITQWLCWIEPHQKIHQPSNCGYRYKWKFLPIIHQMWWYQISRRFSTGQNAKWNNYSQCSHWSNSKRPHSACSPPCTPVQIIRPSSNLHWIILWQWMYCIIWWHTGGYLQQRNQRNLNERSQKFTYWPLHARLRTKDKATKDHDRTWNSWHLLC